MKPEHIAKISAMVKDAADKASKGPAFLHPSFIHSTSPLLSPPPPPDLRRLCFQLSHIFPTVFLFPIRTSLFASSPHLSREFGLLGSRGGNSNWEFRQCALALFYHLITFLIIGSHGNSIFQSEVGQDEFSMARSQMDLHAEFDMSGFEI